MRGTNLALSALVGLFFQTATTSAYTFTLGREIFQNVEPTGADPTETIAVCTKGDGGSCGPNTKVGEANSADITNPPTYGTVDCPDELCVTFMTTMSQDDIINAADGTQVGTLHDNTANVDMNCIARQNTDGTGTDGIGTFININNFVECDPSY